MPVNVKLLSKYLAYRLQDVLPTIVHFDQKGFVKGRSLHHPVRLLDDLQHHATINNSASLAIFLDYEKAYDRVVWDYLFLVLAKLGFGIYFISMIHLLYNKSLARLMLNGYLLRPLETTRGVKQVDPLSSLLFILCIELLGNLVRSRKDLGILFSESIQVTGLYFADDSTLISGNISGIRQQLEIVDIYCQGSGARLNLRKSALMPLNRHLRCPDVAELRCMQPNDTIKYLGIPFGQHITPELILGELNAKFFRGFGREEHERFVADCYSFALSFYQCCGISLRIP
ncbi:Pol Polyprotein [Phytophthora megakarya]|uniref:Pol Polyprotein n=1 Tax=Phytophthora megakarya TaxID=4795 RepID=A0A225UNA6_9STRA|nr:Pol Polyprotein [Phytophthora megakarya]